MDRHRGHVLMMTLLLIAVAAAILAGVARRSLSRATQATEARRELQRRWGMLSCQSTLLPAAGEVLTQFERDAQEPMARVSVKFTLTDQLFMLTFADEQAKVNVNALSNRLGRDKAQRVAQGLLREVGCDARVYIARSLLARSASENQQDDDERRAFAIGCLDQVLPEADTKQFFGSIHRSTAAPGTNELEPGVGAYDVLTCWGNGRLRLSRASKQALEATCGGVLSRIQIHTLLKQREQQPDMALDQAATILELDDTQMQQIKEILTDQSTCYSLRVFTLAPTRMPNARNARELANPTTDLLVNAPREPQGAPQGWYRLAVRGFSTSDEDESQPNQANGCTLTW